MKKIIDIILETDKIFFDDDKRRDVAKKGDADYVTRADKEISSYLHRRLKEEFPDADFMSEEEEIHIDKNRDYFILDPIDGTTNFMHGISLSAVSLGLCRGGEVVAGVIYIPYAKEIFYAEKGKGAYLNGKRIECSKNDELAESLGLLEFNSYFKNDYKEATEHARKIYCKCQDIRVFGCAAADMAYIACGRADVFLGRYLKPWDYAAGLIIVREAGGIVSEIDGEIDITKMNRHIIASNSFVYEKFLSLIKETEK